MTDNPTIIFDSNIEQQSFLPTEIRLVRIVEFGANYEVFNGIVFDALSPFYHYKLKPSFLIEPNSGPTIINLVLTITISVHETAAENLPQRSLAQISLNYQIDYYFQDIEAYFARTNHSNIGVHSQATLLGIAISTLRGVLLSRLQHTAFAKSQMPIINPYQILQDAANATKS